MDENNTSSQVTKEVLDASNKVEVATSNESISPQRERIIKLQNQLRETVSSTDKQGNPAYSLEDVKKVEQELNEFLQKDDNENILEQVPELKDVQVAISSLIQEFESMEQQKPDDGSLLEADQFGEETKPDGSLLEADQLTKEQQQQVQETVTEIIPEIAKTIATQVKDILNNEEFNEDQKRAELNNVFSALQIEEVQLDDWLIEGADLSNVEQQVINLVQSSEQLNQQLTEQAQQSLSETIRSAPSGGEGSQGGEPSNSEVFRAVSGATEKTLDNLNLPGFIDLIFAIHAGSGYYGGSRYENYGKDMDSEKENKAKKVEEIIEEISGSDNKEAVRGFLTTFTGVDNDAGTGTILYNLDQKFSQYFDSGDESEMKKVRKLLVEALEKAKEMGINVKILKDDDVEFSKEVIKKMAELVGKL